MHTKEKVTQIMLLTKKQKRRNLKHYDYDYEYDCEMHIISINK